ncbi:MAG: hypothetical protein KBD78_16355 [Oligoflexales bacterium]|nr:hypothetical protein [Oligoflexales bacterium]
MQRAITALPTSNVQNDIPKVLSQREMAEQYFSPYEIKTPGYFKNEFESLAIHGVELCDSSGISKAARIMSGRVLSTVRFSKVADDKEIYILEFPKLGAGPLGIRIGKYDNKHYFLGFAEVTE